MFKRTQVLIYSYAGIHVSIHMLHAYLSLPIVVHKC